jgi:hypothetical protein
MRLQALFKAFVSSGYLWYHYTQKGPHSAYADRHKGACLLWLGREVILVPIQSCLAGRVMITSLLNPTGPSGKDNLVTAQ